MKTTSITSAVALLVLAASAAPTGTDSSKVDVSGVDFSKITYPKGTGENLPSYPAPVGGWANVDYSGKGKNDCTDGPFKFTSTYHVMATPDQVVNGTTLTGGLKGAVGYYDFGINSDYDFICFNIKLVNFTGEYQSPAKTATHLHQAAKGASGPPRLAFPNPAGNGTERYSRGCLMAPYTTGVMSNGVDTGAGFSVKQIEANPAAFFADVHSSLAVPGAVRGQIA